MRYNPSKKDKSCADSPPDLALVPLLALVVLDGRNVGCTRPKLGWDELCETGGNDCAVGRVALPDRLGLRSVEDEDEGGGASWFVSNVPNESSSLNDSRSVAFCGGTPGTGNSSACGSGDGGAGHCPGRAAARSMRLSVCRCCDALTLFSPDARLIDWWDCRDCLDGTRGGEGVRNTVGDDSVSSKPVRRPF